jgi:DNA polymerase phi
MSTTLPLYWNLSSADKEERFDASVQLVSSVLEFQAQFAGSAAPGESTSAEDSNEDEEQTRLNGLDELNAEDVRYAVRRLIRGLASPRESSRLGFAVALTEVK